MARTVSTETRQDLLQAVRERYRGSLKEEKLRILDEFVAVTGYHRKHIIRLFNAAPCPVSSQSGEDGFPARPGAGKAVGQNRTLTVSR